MNKHRQNFGLSDEYFKTSYTLTKPDQNPISHHIQDSNDALLMNIRQTKQQVNNMRQKCQSIHQPKQPFTQNRPTDKPSFSLHTPAAQLSDQFQSGQQFCRPFINNELNNSNQRIIDDYQFRLDTLEQKLRQKDKEVSQLQSTIKQYKVQINGIQTIEDSYKDEIQQVGQELQEWKKKYFQNVKDFQQKIIHTQKLNQAEQQQLTNHYENYIKTLRKDLEILEMRYEHERDLYYSRIYQQPQQQELEKMLEAERRKNDELAKEVGKKADLVTMLEATRDELKSHISQLSQKLAEFQRQKSLDKTVDADSVLHLEATLKQKDVQITQLLGQLEESREQIEFLQTDYSQLKQNHDLLGQELMEMKERLGQCVENSEKLSQKVREKDAKLKEQTGRLDEQVRLCEQLEEDRARLQNQIDAQAENLIKQEEISKVQSEENEQVFEQLQKLQQMIELQTSVLEEKESTATQLRNDVLMLQLQLTQEQDKYRQAELANEQLGQENGKLKQRLIEIEAELDQNDAGKDTEEQISRELESSKKESAALKMEVNNFQKLLQQHEDELKSLSQQNKRLQDEKERLLQDFNERGQLLVTFEQQNEQSQYLTEQAEMLNEQLKQEISEQRAQIEDLKCKLKGSIATQEEQGKLESEWKEMLKQLKSQNQQLSQENQTLKSELEQNQKTIEEIQEQLSTQQEALDLKENQIGLMNAKIEELQLIEDFATDFAVQPTQPQSEGLQQAEQVGDQTSQGEQLDPEQEKLYFQQQCQDLKQQLALVQSKNEDLDLQVLELLASNEGQMQKLSEAQKIIEDLEAQLLQQSENKGAASKTQQQVEQNQWKEMYDSLVREFQTRELMNKINEERWQKNVENLQASLQQLQQQQQNLQADDELEKRWREAMTKLEELELERKGMNKEIQGLRQRVTELTGRLEMQKLEGDWKIEYVKLEDFNKELIEKLKSLEQLDKQADSKVIHDFSQSLLNVQLTNQQQQMVEETISKVGANEL